MGCFVFCFACGFDCDRCLLGEFWLLVIWCLGVSKRWFGLWFWVWFVCDFGFGCLCLFVLCLILVIVL